MSDPRLVLRRAWLLALALLVAGFCVGYGYGFGRRNAANPRGTSPAKTPTPPAVKGMRVAPGGKLLGFTATYDNARLASRFILDLTTQRYDAREAPRGWQDYVQVGHALAKCYWSAREFRGPLMMRLPGSMKSPSAPLPEGSSGKNLHW